MTRIALIASALTLSAALAGCVSESDTASTPTASTAAADAAQPIRIADTTPMQPLPQAVATEGPEDALQLPVAYACDGGRTFTAVFPGNGRSVTIAAAGETRVLPHRGASDTVMFSDGAVTMTAEGADATLSGVGDGPYTGCMAG